MPLAIAFQAQMLDCSFMRDLSRRRLSRTQGRGGLPRFALIGVGTVVAVALTLRSLHGLECFKSSPDCVRQFANEMTVLPLGVTIRVLEARRGCCLERLGRFGVVVILSHRSLEKLRERVIGAGIQITLLL